MNLGEVGNFLNRIKKRFRENSENLHGLNETILHMRNSMDSLALEDDPLPKGLSLMSNQDLGLKSIRYIPTGCNQLIRRVLPEDGVFKTIVSPNKLELITYRSMFFNPRTGTFETGRPMEGVSTVIKEYHRMINEYLNRNLGTFPMSYEQLIDSPHGTMWKALNMAADSLINGFLIQLGELEALSAGILAYDASDCVLNIVMCQTPDSISFIYGNLFTMVKLGASFRKLCTNYHIWDGTSLFRDTSGVVPVSIQELVTALQEVDNIDCLNIIKFREALKYDLRSTNIFQESDILDGVGKQALGLKGIVPNIIGAVL